IHRQTKSRGRTSSPPADLQWLPLPTVATPVGQYQWIGHGAKTFSTVRCFGLIKTSSMNSVFSAAEVRSTVAPSSRTSPNPGPTRWVAVLRASVAVPLASSRGTAERSSTCVSSYLTITLRGLPLSALPEGLDHTTETRFLVGTTGDGRVGLSGLSAQALVTMTSARSASVQ